MATQSWKVLNAPLLPFAKVAFANACSGIVVGGNGSIVTTTNGGTNWIERTSGTNVTLRGVAVSGLERAWAVGDDGTIVATTDSGVTFMTQNSGTSLLLEAVSFVSLEKGWVVGERGTILSTDDGGVTWVDKTSNNADPARNDLIDVF